MCSTILSVLVTGTHLWVFLKVYQAFFSIPLVLCFIVRFVTFWNIISGKNTTKRGFNFKFNMTYYACTSTTANKSMKINKLFSHWLKQRSRHTVDAKKDRELRIWHTNLGLLATIRARKFSLSNIFSVVVTFSKVHRNNNHSLYSQRNAFLNSKK